MTASGDIVLVETKLFRNPQARREVLGQALDYAIAIFGMSYEQFATAALRGTFDPKPRPASLYEALPEAGKPEEPVFVDAVSRNLRAGRALIIIAGDGIRSEAEELLAGLPVHARFGFMLALVELNVFQMPEANRFLVRPRTLAKTVIVQRTVVEITGGSAVVSEKYPTAPETLSTESYWQTLEGKAPGAQKALEKLITDAESMGVYPEFLGSLNLKLARPGGKPLNLGYVQKSGSVWTDAAAWFGPHDLARAYVAELASAFECDVHPIVGSGATSVYTAHSWTLYKDGKPLRLKDVLDRLELWLDPMQRFITAVQKHDMEQQQA